MSLIALDLQEAVLDVMTQKLETPVIDVMPQGDDYYPEAVIIGATYDSEEASTAESVPQLMPYKYRDESGTINVSVVVQSGDVGFKERRARLKEIVRNIFEVIGEDPCLGLSGYYQSPEIKGISTKYRSGANNSGRFVEAVLGLKFVGVEEY